MPSIKSFESDLAFELKDTLLGRNQSLDVKKFRQVIDDIGIKQIIDTEGVFDNIDLKKLTEHQRDILVDRELESVIDFLKRPSLLITQGGFDPSPSETWNNILTQSMPTLTNSIPAIGRIEVKNHDQKEWIGTGFLLKDDIVVTNRHVAKEFLETSAPFSRRKNEDGKFIVGRIDFKEEYQQPDEEEFKFSEVLYMANEDEPDIALLRCPGASDHITPLALTDGLNEDDIVAAIGYPWKDSRGIAALEKVMKHIFNNIYGVKRIAPGKVLNVRNGKLYHDCTTLGGNSGTPIINLEDGLVAGVHFKGARKYNLAVTADVLRSLLP